MRLCGTLPYAFAMLIQATARECLCDLASLIKAANFYLCSDTPGTDGRNAFWIEGSGYSLANMCCIHLSFRMPENSLLSAGVRAIGLKSLGDEDFL